MKHEKFEVAFTKALDGRSLIDSTLKSVYDKDYKGKSKTVLAVKYLRKLPKLLDSETKAIKFIQGITEGRPFGWKSIADVVYLCMNHSDTPVKSLRACMVANMNYKHHLLSDGTPANDGGKAIADELKKQTGMRIGQGAYGSETKAATTENSRLRISKLKERIVEALDKKDYESMSDENKNKYGCYKFIATNNMENEKSLMKILNKATNLN